MRPWLFINCAMNVVLPPGAAQKSKIVRRAAVRAGKRRAACRGLECKTSRREKNSPATIAADATSTQRPGFPRVARGGRNRIRHFRRAIFSSSLPASVFKVLTRAKVFGGVLFHSKATRFFQCPSAFASGQPAIRDATSPVQAAKFLIRPRSFLVSSCSRR